MAKDHSRRDRRNEWSTLVFHSDRTSSKDAGTAISKRQDG